MLTHYWGTQQSQMPGVISSISKPIFEKSRIKWSVGFVLGFLGTLCGRVCVTVISWAQPKPSCCLLLVLSPAWPALRGGSHLELMGLPLPWGLGFWASGLQVLPCKPEGQSAWAAALLTPPPNSLCCPHLLCPQHSVLPLLISSCPLASLLFSAALVGWPGSPGTAAVAVGRSRWAAVLGLLAFGGGLVVGAGVVISPHPACVCACAHTRAHTRTHAPALLRERGAG